VADTTTKQKALIASIRDSISDAYGFVRGSQYTKRVSQTTYEQLVDAAIGKIRGTPGVVTTRPSKLARIETVRSNLVSALEVVKDTPVTAWVWGTDQAVANKDNANPPENA
jgi:hypothetical protein